MSITLLLIITFLTYVSPIKHEACSEQSKQWLESKITSITENIGYEGNQIVKSPEKGCTYLVAAGVVDIEASRSRSSLIRVASVKARRQALLFLQSPKVTTDMIVTMEQIITDEDILTLETYFDFTSEEAAGFVGEMQSLKSFEAEDGTLLVYVLFKEIN